MGFFMTLMYCSSVNSRKKIYLIYLIWFDLSEDRLRFSSFTCNSTQFWIENSSFTYKFPQFCLLGRDCTRLLRIWAHFLLVRFAHIIMAWLWAPALFPCSCIVPLLARQVRCKQHSIFSSYLCCWSPPLTCDTRYEGGEAASSTGSN